MPKITKRFLDSLRPPERGERRYFDERLPGFGVRVRETGAIAFVYQYRVKGRRKSQTRTIGRYPKLTVEMARTEAKRLAGELVSGTDPAEELRTRQAHSQRFETLADLYFENYLKRTRTDKAVATTLELLDPLKEQFGVRPWRELTSADVERFHRSRTATPRQANKLVDRLSSVLNYGQKLNRVPTWANPCLDVDRFPERKRERYFSEDELQRIAKAISQLEDEGGIPQFAGPAIRFLALTGLRLREALTLRWEDVDFDRGSINLRSTKTGPRGQVPLPSAAIDLLSDLDRFSENPYCFPGGLRGQELKNLQRPFKAACELAGVPDARLHDLRHSAASLGISSGLSLPMIGGVLGHRSPSTTNRYAHLADDLQRQAANLIGDAVAAALGSKPKDQE